MLGTVSDLTDADEYQFRRQIVQIKIRSSDQALDSDSYSCGDSALVWWFVFSRKYNFSLTVRRVREYFRNYHCHRCSGYKQSVRSVMRGIWRNGLMHLVLDTSTLHLCTIKVNHKYKYFFLFMNLEPCGITRF